MRARQECDARREEHLKELMQERSVYEGSETRINIEYLEDLYEASDYGREGIFGRALLMPVKMLWKEKKLRKMKKVPWFYTIREERKDTGVWETQFTRSSIACLRARLRTRSMGFWRSSSRTGISGLEIPT
ncbi:MAG: hypothetical protein ABEJ95_06930 [Candidatus Nanohalobium sp.]